MTTLYVLRDPDSGMRYVGITNDLSRRLREHRKKQSVGSRRLGNAELVHTEEFPDYTTARKREKQLKSGAGHRWLTAFLAEGTSCPGPAVWQDEVRAWPAERQTP